VTCCININRKLIVRSRTTPPGGAEDVHFLEIGNFERPSLTHHVLPPPKFSFTTQV